MPISYKDLYGLVDDRTNQIMEKFDGLEKRVSALEGLKTQVVLLATIVGTIVSLSMDWLKRKLFGT